VLTVLIDDIRWFRDGRDCTIARSSRKAIELLNGLKGRHIDELWLDHDLRARTRSCRSSTCGAARSST